MQDYINCEQIFLMKSTGKRGKCISFWSPQTYCQQYELDVLKAIS